MIDLRSDTVTAPTAGMRAAMASAEVGDDFYLEDPTVAELESRAARLLGKERALFLTSGTMANLVAHLSHAPEGGEVVGPEGAHTFQMELSGCTRIAGLHPRTFPMVRGGLDTEAYSSRIHEGSTLSRATSLLWVEQPIDGHVVPLAALEALGGVARQSGVPLHMDGARLLNAAAALGVSPGSLAEPADSVMLSLSKGLGAPFGSVLAGSASFIERARVARQLVGGGLRQGGHMAAAGLYALDNHVDRLAADHEHARLLARALVADPRVHLDREQVETNMFYVSIDGSDVATRAFRAGLMARGVLVNPPLPGSAWIRLVTHLGVSRGDIETVAHVARETLAATQGSSIDPKGGLV